MRVFAIFFLPLRAKTWIAHVASRGMKILADAHVDVKGDIERQSPQSRLAREPVLDCALINTSIRQHDITADGQN